MSLPRSQFTVENIHWIAGHVPSPPRYYQHNDNAKSDKDKDNAEKDITTDHEPSFIIVLDQNKIRNLRFVGSIPQFAPHVTAWCDLLVSYIASPEWRRRISHLAASPARGAGIQPDARCEFASPSGIWSFNTDSFPGQAGVPVCNKEDETVTRVGRTGKPERLTRR